MKNLERISLGFIVGIAAFGFSAYTQIHKNQKTEFKLGAIPENFFLQRAPNQFTPVISSPNPLLCETPTSLYCFYNVTLLGKTNIPSLISLGQSYYTPSQIGNYLMNGWLAIPVGSTKALYVNP